MKSATTKLTEIHTKEVTLVGHAVPDFADGCKSGIYLPLHVGSNLLVNLETEGVRGAWWQRGSANRTNTL